MLYQSPIRPNSTCSPISKKGGCIVPPQDFHGGRFQHQQVSMADALVLLNILLLETKILGRMEH